jgi:hypothetical protein
VGLIAPLNSLKQFDFDQKGTLKITLFNPTITEKEKTGPKEGITQSQSVASGEL